MDLKQVMQHFKIDSYTEAGRLLGVSQPAVSNWVARGFIPELQQRRYAELSGGALQVAPRQPARDQVQEMQSQV